MAVIQSGVGADLLTVDANTKAARVTQRPTDVGALGAYAFATDNGGTVMTAGLGAASEIYQFRWTHATNLCIVRSVRFSMGSVVAFVAGRLLFELLVVRGFSAAGTGGAAATLTNNKKRNSFAATTLGEIRTATTAALGAGTKTFDPNPIANMCGGAPTTVGMIIPLTAFWARDTGDEYPIVLVQNEGLVIRATVPGTGTWYFGVSIGYAELTAF